MHKIILLLWGFAAIGLTAGEMNIPERWRPPEIAGKEYRIGFKPRGYVIRDPEFMKLPLNRDAFWMILGSGNAPDFFKDSTTNKSSYNHAALMESGNPLMIFTTSYYTNTLDKWSFLGDSWPAFRKAAGSRILGTLSTECIQSFNASQKRYQLPNPKSRHEAYELLRGTWNCRTMSQFRDLSVFFQWGLPRYAGTATYFDHMLLDFGSKCAGHECGSKINDMPMQFAVSRGAARQYGTFFYSYLATMNDFRYPGHAGRKASFYSHREYNFLIPQERRVHAVGHHVIVTKLERKPKPPTCTTRGPECGVLDCVYRQWFVYAFMSGTGLYFDESGHRFMYSLYDHRTISGDDPLVINLRDRKYHLSKTGELLADFYDRIASRIDRGIVCTPIALVWDRYHGYGPKYAGPMPWNNRFPLPGDKMFSLLESYLFPKSPRTTEENVTTRTSPFGDIFDVITNDASQEAMDAYPALLLTGDVSMEHSGFGKRLVQYLKNGGTVIASKCQLKGIPGLSVPDKDNIQEIPFGKGKLIVSAQDYWLEDGKIDDELGSVIRKIADEQLPVKVSGDVQYLVNRTRDGVIVSLFNNYGRALNRTWNNPDPGPDPKETQKVAITLKQPASEVRELLTERPMPVRDGRIETSIRGGEVQLIQITLKKKLQSPSVR